MKELDRMKKIEIDEEENIIEIRLTEEQIEEINNLSSGEHVHFDIEDKQLIINKI